jgi:hypothetical protein
MPNFPFQVMQDSDATNNRVPTLSLGVLNYAPQHHELNSLKTSIKLSFQMCPCPEDKSAQHSDYAHT